jgi:hypothetical protein
MNSRPIGGCSSETSSHPIDMNNKKLAFCPIKHETRMLSSHLLSWNALHDNCCTGNFWNAPHLVLHLTHSLLDTWRWCVGWKHCFRPSSNWKLCCYSLHCHVFQNYYFLVKISAANVVHGFHWLQIPLTFVELGTLCGQLLHWHNSIFYGK